MSGRQADREPHKAKHKQCVLQNIQNNIKGKMPHHYDEKSLHKYTTLWLLFWALERLGTASTPDEGSISIQLMAKRCTTFHSLFWDNCHFSSSAVLSFFSNVLISEKVRLSDSLYLIHTWNVKMNCPSGLRLSLEGYEGIPLLGLSDQMHWSFPCRTSWDIRHWSYGLTSCHQACSRSNFTLQLARCYLVSFADMLPRYAEIHM